MKGANTMEIWGQQTFFKHTGEKTEHSNKKYTFSYLMEMSRFVRYKHRRACVWQGQFATENFQTSENLFNHLTNISAPWGLPDFTATAM